MITKATKLKSKVESDYVDIRMDLELYEEFVEMNPGLTIKDSERVLLEVLQDMGYEIEE